MDRVEILKKYPFYNEANSSLQQRITEAAIPATLDVGEFYFRESDECTQVALTGKGSIRVFKSGEVGREITLYHVNSGDTCILTASCVLSRMCYPASAIVEAQVDALVFPAIAFREWIATSEVVRQFVFKTLARRMADVMTLVEEITFNKMDRRLAEFLLRGFANSNKPVKLLKLTHEQIAAELGSAREVISRLLKEFERLGAIKLGRARVLLKNRGLLIEQVGSENATGEKREFKP